jgi:hypothetical protein
MYFPLEINEQLANAMRATAEAKAEIGVFMKSEEKNSTKRVSMESINELDEILCDVVCRIASLTSSVMSACAIDESDKEIKNRLNLENHVSE